MNPQVVSGYSAAQCRPFVTLRIGAHVAQMAPSDARDLGQQLIAAAAAAEGDGLLVELLGALTGAPPSDAAGTITALRRRQQRM